MLLLLKVGVALVITLSPFTGCPSPLLDDLALFLLALPSLPCEPIFHIELHDFGAEEMARCLRPLIALAEDPSLVTRTHIRWLTPTCDSSSMGPTASSGLNRYLYVCFVCRHKSIQIIQNRIIP